MDRQRELRMMADIMIGGNHLASALIHNIGANFADAFPPHDDPERVLNRLSAAGLAGNGNIVYDCWVAWAAIMRARTLARSPEQI